MSQNTQSGELLWRYFNPRSPRGRRCLLPRDATDGHRAVGITTVPS